MAAVLPRRLSINRKSLTAAGTGDLLYGNRFFRRNRRLDSVDLTEHPIRIRNAIDSNGFITHTTDTKAIKAVDCVCLDGCASGLSRYVDDNRAAVSKTTNRRTSAALKVIALIPHLQQAVVI
jgi:hypothetical protein